MKFSAVNDTKACAPLPVTTVILAGGEGKRIGVRKLFLKVDGRRMIDLMISRVYPFCREILLSCSPLDVDFFESEGITGGHLGLVDGIVTDSAPGKGPLEGLVKGLRSASNDWIFLVGCDMPCLMESVVRRIWEFRKEDSGVIVPLLNGYNEPLHAFYSTRCLPEAERCLSGGVRKITSFFENITVTEVSEDSLRDIPEYQLSFTNINTHDQLLAWRDQHRLS